MAAEGCHLYGSRLIIRRAVSPPQRETSQTLRRPGTPRRRRQQSRPGRCGSIHSRPLRGVYPRPAPSCTGRVNRSLLPATEKSSRHRRGRSLFDTPKSNDVQHVDQWALTHIYKSRSPLGFGSTSTDGDPNGSGGRTTASRRNLELTQPDKRNNCALSAVSTGLGSELSLLHGRACPFGRQEKCPQ